MRNVIVDRLDIILTLFEHQTHVKPIDDYISHRVNSMHGEKVGVLDKLVLSLTATAEGDTVTSFDSSRSLELA